MDMPLCILERTPLCGVVIVGEGMKVADGLAGDWLRRLLCMVNSGSALVGVGGMSIGRYMLMRVRQ